MCKDSNPPLMLVGFSKRESVRLSPCLVFKYLSSFASHLRDHYTMSRGVQKQTRFGTKSRGMRKGLSL